MKDYSVGVNSFVERQTKHSGKTYAKTLSFNDIADHASKQLAKDNYKNGYRDGVILVNVDKKFVDDFDSAELSPHRESFLRGGRILHAHSTLQKAKGMGYLSDWAGGNFSV